MSESPEPIIYAYSVKVECGAKGDAKPTVHVYSNDIEQARSQAVKLYLDTLKDLSDAGQPVPVEVVKKE